MAMDYPWWGLATLVPIHYALASKRYMYMYLLECIADALF